MTGCPVKPSERSGGAFGWWGGGANASSPKTDSIGATPPVQPPNSYEESLGHAQSPHSDQRIPLNTERSLSSIPRGEDDPDRDGDGKWVYPSEQQFYNAMRRKGWDTNEENMAAVVQIHNAVNERSWDQVRRWEKETHNCDDPKLLKFEGRPKDMSPKAFFNTYFFMYNPPFDRHDWYVKSNDDTVTRYVIDFYNGGSSSNTSNNAVPSMYLDVRPALDKPVDLLNRAQAAVKDFLPGIFPRN